jgi:Domain of unknown function (DUF4167)
LLNNRQPNNRRRGRGRGPSGNGQRDNQSRIDSRARGNAPQMLEKFKNLAREAQQQSDRVMTEYYLQFADHYFRIVAESRARMEESRPQPRRDEWQSEDEAQGEMMDGQNQAQDQMGEDDDSYENEVQQQTSNRAPRPPREARAPREPRRPPNRSRSDGVDGNRQPRRDRNDQGDEDMDGDRDAPGISIDMLPPAIGVTADPMPDIDEAPAPAPRPRRRVSRLSPAATEVAGADSEV